MIADNLSAHKTKQVTEFLARHPTVHLHFTPTYASWLNQVELWFAKIERDVQDGMNLISGNHQTSNRLPAFSLTSPIRALRGI